MEKGINVDTIVNGLVSGLIEFGNIIKQDKTNTNKLITELQKKLKETEEKLVVEPEK